MLHKANGFSVVARTLVFFIFIFAGLMSGPALFYGGEVHFQSEKMNRLIPVADAITVTSTISISICGDALVNPPAEACDDGVNNGFYSTTIAGRNCLPDCSSFAPYCGDAIYQPVRGEACDDGNNASGDGCILDCTATETIDTGGGGSLGGTFFAGGLSSPPPTRIIVNGTAYPSAKVHVLRDGTEIGSVTANGLGEFSFNTSNISAGIATFGFWAEDRNGVKSLTVTVTIQVIANTATTISGVYLPPSLDLSKRQVAPESTLAAFGQSLPGAEIQVYINTNPGPTSTGDGVGLWSADYDVSLLAVGEFHNIKALFRKLINGEDVESGFGPAVTFFVGDGDIGEIDFCVRSDINTDSSVNLVDFSILLFNFGSSDSASDINSDGNVNLADFSIMLFCWTG